MDTLSRLWNRIFNFNRVGPQPVEYEMERRVMPSPNVLSVVAIDYFVKQNGPLHKTESYDCMQRSVNQTLVIRRGQSFKIGITFNRSFNLEEDTISFTFCLKDEIYKPTIAQGTMIPMSLLMKNPNKVIDWKVIYESQTESTLIVEIYTPANCIIGAWTLEVNTKFEEDTATFVYQTPIFILFNPWCPDDDVHLENERAKYEYVELNYGYIYVNEGHSKLWKYNQHERGVLECVIYLLSKFGNILPINRYSPILISRALTAVVNHKENGLVTIALNGNYGDEMDPSMWKSSTEIIQYYYKTKLPSKYANSCVFAGLLTTVCRTIGLPCRPVTNYDSIHNHAGSTLTEVLINYRSKEIKREAVWNFHIWNEVWMKRPDLGRRYSGWQAVDSTPLEKSDGIFRCGPAPVIAIKNGDVNKSYDTHIFYARVNSDVIRWRLMGKCGRKKLINVQRKCDYSLMLTKTICQEHSTNISSNYKNLLPSPQSSLRLFDVFSHPINFFIRYRCNPELEDIDLDFQLKDNYLIGQRFIMVLEIENSRSRMEHKVIGSLRIDMISFAGRFLKHIKTHHFDTFVSPLCTESIEVTVPFDMYYKPSISDYYFHAACFAEVMGTGYEFYDTRRFEISKPDITITVSGTPCTGKPVEVVLRLPNTLPIPLTSAEFYIEAFNPPYGAVYIFESDIQPGHFAIASFHLVIPNKGKHSIVARFKSKEISGACGHNFVANL